MAATTNLNIRIDRKVKEEADQLFSDLGMNMTTAINVFVRQAIRQGGIPFTISLGGGNAENHVPIPESAEPSGDADAKR